MLPPRAVAALFTSSALLQNPRHAQPLAKGPPPIASKFFEPLESPANYTHLIDTSAADVVSVIKFQAPFCRTCRATSPLLDRVAKQYPEANYYSMNLNRNGKAAGERMNKFFKEKGVKLMPYIEIYIGSECVHTEVTPPSALLSFEQAVGSAFESLRAASSGKQGAGRQLVMLRQFLREKQAEVAAATRRSGSKRARRAQGSTTDDAPPAPAAQGLASFLASSPWQRRQKGARQASDAWLEAKGSSASGAPRAKRGAPLRGATGGRKKGWR